MKVRISYIGNVKGVSGKDDEEVELNDGATLPHLLRTLSKKYEKFNEIYDDKNGFLSGGYCLVIHNQLILSLTPIPEIKLAHEDRILITPIVVGG